MIILVKEPHQLQLPTLSSALFTDVYRDKPFGEPEKLGMVLHDYNLSALGAGGKKISRSGQGQG